jgi:hypothetical protein
MSKADFMLRLRTGPRVFTTLISIWFVCLFFPVGYPAEGSTVKLKLPETIYPGLDHLLDLVDPDKKVSFDPRMIERVLDFVEGPKDGGAIYFEDRTPGLPSAYYEFDIRKDLRDIAAYSFNPDIPCIATMPSSTRLFQWLDEKGRESSPPRVGRYLAGPVTPVVIKGLRFVENTPDITSGAYYAYNLYQALIIDEYRGHNVLITISRQTDVSTVGKKGYVLGADEDWDYFYSGKQGLTLPALGWVRSYMYESRTVAVYDEIDHERPKVRCAVFKWLRAGWSGINMVKNKHIYDGIKRFAAPFKEIIESPLLPPVEALASDFKRIRGFPDNILRSKMKIYLSILKDRYSSGNLRAQNLPSALFDNADHWQGMSRDEMQTPLVVEYMKYAVGKTSGKQIRNLLDLD